MPFNNTLSLFKKSSYVLLAGIILTLLFYANGVSVAWGGVACGSGTQCPAGFVCTSDYIGGPTTCHGLNDSACTGTGQGDCAPGLICANLKCINDQGATSASLLKLGEESTDIRIQINRVINIFLSFLAIIGVTLIIYGGILWATAGGNDEQVGKAKKTMIAAAIGLIVIGVAWTVISYVINLGGSIS